MSHFLRRALEFEVLGLSFEKLLEAVSCFLSRRSEAPTWKALEPHERVGRSWEAVALLLAVALASSFYLWQAPKITRNLPYTHYWDEDQVILMPARIMQDREADLVSHPYPPLTGYLSLPLLYPLLAYDLLTGAVESVNQYGLARIELWDVRPPHLLFFARMSVVLWAAAALVLIYLLVRQFAPPLLALVGCASIFTMHQYYNPDHSLPYIFHPNSLVGFVFAASILSAVLTYRYRHYWLWFAAAAWGGAAVMLKYVTFPCCFPIVIAWAATLHRSSLRGALHTGALIAVGGLGGAYFVHPNFFNLTNLGVLQGAMETYAEGGELMISGVMGYVRSTPGFAALSLAAVAGFFVRPAVTSMIVFPVIAYVIVLGQQRYGGVMAIVGGVTILLPVLALLGLRSVQLLMARLVARIRGCQNRRHPGIELVYGLVVMFGVLAWPGTFQWHRLPEAIKAVGDSEVYWRYSSYEADYLDREENDDPRKSMAWWIRQNLKEGDKVAVDQYLHLYTPDISDAVEVHPVNIKDSQLIDLLKTGSDYFLAGQYSDYASFVDSLKEVRRYNGQSRSLGRDAMDPAWRQTAVLYDLRIENPEHLLFSERYRIDGGHRIALDDFAETSSIYRTSFVNSSSFICPWYWGPKLYSRIAPGRYRFDLYMDSFSWGSPIGFPKASVIVDLLKSPFVNSDFRENSLVNWRLTGTGLGQPVLLNHAFKQPYAINTAAGGGSGGQWASGTLESPEFVAPAGWNVEFAVTQDTRDSSNYLELITPDSTAIVPLPTDGIKVRYPEYPFAEDTRLVVRLHKSGAGTVQFGGFRLIQHNVLGEVTASAESEVYSFESFYVPEEMDMNFAVTHHDNTRPDTNRMLRIHWIEVVAEAREEND